MEMDSYKGPKGDSGPSDRKTRGVKASYNVRHAPGIMRRGVFTDFYQAQMTRRRAVRWRR